MLEFNFNWSKLSAIAAVSWWAFHFRLHPKSVTAAEVAAFLGGLRRRIHGPMLVIWDGVGAHRSRRVQRWVEKQAGAVLIVRMPAYAPELNPAEYLFGHLKEHELPNFCAVDARHLRRSVHRALRGSQHRPSLLRSFWHQAQLSLFQNLT